METVKIIVVDDNVTARSQLKSYIKNHANYEVAADFSGGNQALEWLRENDIDIILCDMQMPAMNGVEFIQMVRVLNEYVPFVAVSSYDDFNYIRGCMVGGAADYLLKHELTEEKLIKVLDDVCRKYKIKPEGGSVRHRIGYYFERKEEFQAERIREMIEKEEIDFSGYNIVPIGISPDYHITGRVSGAEYKKDISQAVMDIASQFLGTDYQYIFHTTKEGRIILLWSFGNANSTLFVLNSINGLCDKLRRKVMRMLDITLTLATGSICRDLDHAMNQAGQLTSLLDDKFYLGENRTIQIEVAEKMEYHSVHIKEQCWEQLAFEMKNADRKGAKAVLTDLFKEMETDKCPREEVAQTAARMLRELEGQGLCTPCETGAVKALLTQMDLFDQYRTCLLDLFDQKIGQAEKDKKMEVSPMVQKVMEYIRQNYGQDISLEDCAQYAQASYTHISREFKRETGMRFVEYLNLIRVNKAKSLLIRRDCSMKEIVKRVGFRNYNYFFKVFKESEGVTPNEYAAKNYSES